MTLGSDRLETGLMICCKRIDTGSPWILTNNPASKYWVSDDGSYKPNRDYEIRTLIRASTAAPYYFEPALIVINEGGKYPAPGRPVRRRRHGRPQHADRAGAADGDASRPTVSAGRSSTTGC